MFTDVFPVLSMSDFPNLWTRAARNVVWNYILHGLVLDSCSGNSIVHRSGAGSRVSPNLLNVRLAGSVTGTYLLNLGHCYDYCGLLAWVLKPMLHWDT